MSFAGQVCEGCFGPELRRSRANLHLFGGFSFDCRRHTDTNAQRYRAEGVQ